MVSRGFLVRLAKYGNSNDKRVCGLSREGGDEIIQRVRHDQTVDIA